ncbi:glyoxalase superfamily protein [Pelagibacterium lentulum]|uniref:Glyoxalase-related protein domain-containing protein n=1 Tax=Pelagibacterium lentulum TaxID=2029865 RepID=A0A916R850_9HYPH|nr:glyoxalase superfamily protein [Pelagibacterium lentulum]GGA40798.1 hypothetical protein GCM10011499_07960 [Pelagibacterium lentulum]
MHELSRFKTMAKALRDALAEREIELSHGQCLDLVARQQGVANWNVLAARSGTPTTENALFIPESWFPGSATSETYFRFGVARESPGVAKIEARPGVEIPENSFATLMQSFSARAYRSKRVRLVAELKTRAAGAAAIWMRIDPSGGGRHLRFDNMMRRSENGALRGDVEWTERHIVLDVPYPADTIHFGCLLHEKGAVWARNFSLEVVSEDLPVTSGGPYPAGPTNLDFGDLDTQQ